ncbi:preprotein translocase subunit SecE [Saccharospirillum alexandrii]|uniref:preprotein translocase subunit SecE n=1 Tax=Saccharospirillum alexandrii TaxID=2448477 RepID=UPI000FDC8FE5|nr:preprotein translocase subunit SecE [Saccharospirillum alexandrii]
MNAQVESNNTALDWIKWIVVAALMIAVIGGNFYFGDQSMLVRALAVVFVSLIAVGIALTTARGKYINRLRKEAWVEVRKVVWPTRQETTQTSLVVIGVVLVVALILWGVDSLLGLVVSRIIG